MIINLLRSAPQCKELIHFSFGRFMSIQHDEGGLSSSMITESLVIIFSGEEVYVAHDRELLIHATLTVFFQAQ